MLTLLTESDMSTSYRSPSCSRGLFFSRSWKRCAVGSSNRGDPKWCNSPLFLATPIISCKANFSQFAMAPSNLLSPNAISLKGTLSETVVTFSLSSSGLKTLKKMVLLNVSRKHFF